jgi:hypothetical protein
MFFRGLPTLQTRPRRSSDLVDAICWRNEADERKLRGPLIETDPQIYKVTIEIAFLLRDLLDDH